MFGAFGPRRIVRQPNIGSDMQSPITGRPPPMQLTIKLKASMNDSPVRDAIKKAVFEGKSVELSERAAQSFYTQFFHRISPELKAYREEQRRAYGANV